MMKINYKLTTVLLTLGFLFSCESIELDLTESPNALSADQASADFFLNAIQEDFALFTTTLGDVAAQTTRIHYMFGRQYNQAFSAASFDGAWSLAYASILSDLSLMYPLAEEGNLQDHIGIGKTIEALTIVTLVDIFGDVPFSETLQGVENFNPSLDSGADIYDAALVLLDEAEAAFEADATLEPSFDLYFGFDSDGFNSDPWIKTINSARIKILVQRRLVDPTAVASVNAIVAEGNFITSPDEDFEFKWGNNLNNPDTRHPLYAADFTPTGAGNYQSDGLMNFMMSDKVGNAISTFEGMDPRIRFYFYRQNATTPGAPGVPPDQQNLSCSVESPPAHYIAGGFPFCFLPNGYWGRDHGDDDGIPPDGNLRTVTGVYPNGGRFDDDTFAEVDLGLGAGGAGVTPIILSSTIDFLLAELALDAGDTGGARTLILSGIQKSFTKVRSFGPLDTGADLSFAPPTSEDADYITEVGELFDAGTTMEKWNILANEFFVTLIGNGLDAYDFYRRVGAPFDLQANIELDPGPFIRSHFYPANAANTNISITQKPDVTIQVFWDNNPGAGFPIAN